MENVVYYGRCTCGKTDCRDCGTERCTHRCYKPDERTIRFKQLLDKMRQSGQIGQIKKV